MYFPIKFGRESFYSIVCECSTLYIYNSSHASEKTATKHAPSLKLVDCRVAWNERKDLIQLLEVCIKDQYMRYSGCDI